MKKTIAIVLSLALLLACFSISSAAETPAEVVFEWISELLSPADSVPVIGPMDIMMEQGVVKGDTVTLHFIGGTSGAAGYQYNVELVRTERNGPSVTVATWSGDYPTVPGRYHMKIQWDTSGLPTGTYGFNCITSKDGQEYIESYIGSIGPIIVDAPIPLESISIYDPYGSSESLTRLPMPAEGETQLYLQQRPYNHTNSREITVTSSNDAVVSAYALDNNIYLEKHSAEPATITVSMGGKSISFEVYTPGGITLDRESVTLDVGQETLLTATLDAAVATGDVAWSSSDPSVVSVENGLVKALKPGTAAIRASVQGYTAWCTVTVNLQKPATEIQFAEVRRELHLGDEIQLSPILTPLDSDSPISWESYDVNVIMVDQNGLVKAVGAGTSVVNATAKTNGYGISARVSFTVEQCGLPLFSDMPGRSNWAHEGLDFAIDRGLLNGTSSSTISPDMAMSRAMLVTVLWRAEDSPSGGENPFSDVPAGKYYTEAVAWANAHNIVNGVGGGKFDPDGNITREQMAAILFRYAKYQRRHPDARADLSSFPDAGKISLWATEAMQWAVAEGLITGTATNGGIYLDPQGNATRAQVATILMRYYYS
ncbi:MAG: S-layer homology domain-containing protein [Oscillospiraceae bacterium]|jgi:hypothetical protein|nr:S-layer homology domain-containing protein [Oscillospiraceae bacterium]